MTDKLHLRSFGDYVLVDKIASGGMADVFNARIIGIQGFSKAVAIKRIHAHLSEDPNFSAMFIDEAKIASRLSHPNIVQILELGEVKGSPFIAMEFVFGRDLFQILERLGEIGEPCPWPMAIRIALDLAQALHHAHEYRSPDGTPQCIIHRDVSPRNVLISFSGDLKLTDFGIARALDRKAHTEQGQIKGKVRYMSPEAAVGGAIDRRSDIFSLGIVLAELLTMEPFRTGQTDLEVLLAIRDGRDSEHRFESIPPELVFVLSRALNRNPDGRYPTAEAFRADLATLATGSLAPMTTMELGHLVSGLFAKEHVLERHLQVRVDRALEKRHRKLPGESGPPVIPPVPPVATIPPSRSGSLRDTSLTELLGGMHQNRRTGQLNFHRSPLKKSVFFTGGTPVFVVSNVEKEALGEYLVSAGLLTPADHIRIREQTRHGKLRLVDLLLRSKAIAPNELYQALSEQVRDRILDLFTWNDGTFAFFPEGRPPEAGMPLNLRCLDLIHEGVMDRIPLTTIRKSFKKLGNALIRRSIFTIPPDLGLSGWDQRLLHQIEEQPRTLTSLLQDQSREERTLRLIYLLKELDLVELYAQ